MGHEIEKLIQEKVLEADGGPVIWGKERVWRQVHLPVERRSRVPYYAAASVMLAGVVIVYLLQLNELEKTRRRIQFLESAISKELVESHANPARAVEEVDCPADVALTSHPSEKKVSRIPLVTPLPADLAVAEVAQAEIVVTPDHAAVVKEMESGKETPRKEQAVPERRVIQAIVGVIPVRPLTVAKSKNKKVIIQLFQAGENGLYVLEENKFISAKLN